MNKLKTLNLKFQSNEFNELRRKKNRLKAMLNGHLTWEEFLYKSLVQRTDNDNFLALSKKEKKK